MCFQLPNANSLLLLFLLFGFSFSYSLSTTQRKCIICFAGGGGEGTFKKQPSYTPLQLWKMWQRRRKPSPWVVDIREICWMKGIHLIEDLSFCILSRNYLPLYTKLFAFFSLARILKCKQNSYIYCDSSEFTERDQRANLIALFLPPVRTAEGCRQLRIPANNLPCLIIGLSSCL